MSTLSLLSCQVRRNHTDYMRILPLSAVNYDSEYSTDPRLALAPTLAPMSKTHQGPLQLFCTHSTLTIPLLSIRNPYGRTILQPPPLSFEHFNRMCTETHRLSNDLMNTFMAFFQNRACVKLKQPTMKC